MLRQLTVFEIQYHTRQIGFWIAVLIMFLIGALLISFPDATFAASTGEKIKANGAVVTAGITSNLSLFSMFFGAVFVVSGVMRDQVHKSLEMVHATAVSTRDMTLSRMIGVYIATFISIFAMVVGVFAGQFIPWMDKEALGPINLFYYLQPTLLFIAINTLFVSGFFTAIAAFTRNRALVYVSAVGLFITYISASLFVGEDGTDLLTSLADPFGSAALSVTVEFWSAAEQNTQTIPLIGYVGLNRLVWGLIGLALYVVSFSLFKRGLVTGKSKEHEADDDDTGRISLLPTATKMTGAEVWASFWARFKYEYLTTVKSIPFIILTLMSVALFAITVFVQMKFVPNPALPTSPLMATTVFGSMAIPLLIMIIFFSGEIIWRDKSAGMTEIIDASPVLDGPLLAGKWLALLGMVISLMWVGVFFGMASQIILGDVPINFLTYVNITFVQIAPRILALAVLALFIQNFMPNRVVGMLASGAAVIFFFIVIGFLPSVHPMVQFGSLGAGRWSELNGFSSLLRFGWFGLYWGSLIALFVVVSIWLWRRGTQATLLRRFANMKTRMSLISTTLALLFVAGLIGSGGYIFKAYNIDNEYRSAKDNDLRQVKWEKTFGDNRKDPLPKIRSVEVDVMFNPAQQTARVAGSYEIENTNAEPLEQVFVSMVTRHKESIKKLELVGAVQVTEGENMQEIEDFNYRLFRFEPPLAPGARTRMEFETVFHAPKLADNSSIERNGTFVDSSRVLPQFGIRDQRLRNKDKRRKNDLPELEKRADRTDMEARQRHFISSSSDYVNFKAKVCTDVGQIPIAPGKMLAETSENGKTCRSYQTIRPILNFFSFLSADFEVRRDVWKTPNGRDVPLAIYFHKPHDYNVDLMLDAMKGSLDTFTTTFGPYPYNQIRIMEFPYRGFAQSFAGTIPFSERIGFVMQSGDPTDNKKVDLATYVTMHEIGHQWFAHQIVPADTKGFNVLSEGL
ncbi:hypothetical protein MNBD_ALPHA06-1537, partial [hydrothermal vent metagenome]